MKFQNLFNRLRQLFGLPLRPKATDETAVYYWTPTSFWDVERYPDGRIVDRRSGQRAEWRA